MSWEPIPETLTLSEVHWQGSWEMMRAPETVEGAFLINRNWSEARQEIQWRGGVREERPCDRSMPVPLFPVPLPL